MNETIDYITQTDLLTEYAQNLWTLSDNAYFHGSPWTKDQFLTDLHQNTSFYLVLSRSEEWIGFISYQRIIDEVDITHIVVNNQFQQQGYASKLMDYLVEDLRNKKIIRVFLEVRCSNKKAQDFYYKKGFELLSKRKKYYHQPVEDGLVMRLMLEDEHQ